MFWMYSDLRRISLKEVIIVRYVYLICTDVVFLQEIGIIGNAYLSLIFRNCFQKNN
mgnify:CR=1 FL=1